MRSSLAFRLYPITCSLTHSPIWLSLPSSLPPSLHSCLPVSIRLATPLYPDQPLSCFEVQCRLALHIMCFSNPKAVAVLWQRFVRHLREACWDAGCLLPRMDPPQPLSSPGASDPTADQGVRSSGLSRPDFSCCLLHQKLQMLNLCIHQAHKLQPRQASVAVTTQVQGCSYMYRHVITVVVHIYMCGGAGISMDTTDRYSDAVAGTQRE